MRETRRARLQAPGQLWGRRTALAGLALIALAVLGGLILLTDDGDDGGDRTGGGDRTAVQEGVSQSQPEVGQSLNDAKSGISVEWPSDWTKVEKRGAIGFQSPDKTLLVLISAPADAADADQLRKDAIAATAAGYKNPVVRPGKGRTIGGLPADGATVSGQGPGGQSVTLVAVAAGKQKAYLFEVLTAENAPTKRLVEAQLILNSLQLSR
jgi:hypothetical protein